MFWPNNVTLFGQNHPKRGAFGQIKTLVGDVKTPETKILEPVGNHRRHGLCAQFGEMCIVRHEVRCGTVIAPS